MGRGGTGGGGGDDAKDEEDNKDGEDGCGAERGRREEAGDLADDEDRNIEANRNPELARLRFLSLSPSSSSMPPNGGAVGLALRLPAMTAIFFVGLPVVAFSFPFSYSPLLTGITTPALLIPTTFLEKIGAVVVVEGAAVSQFSEALLDRPGFALP